MKGRLLAGRYEIVRLVANGGMGSIWQALDRQLDRRVALKMLRALDAPGENAGGGISVEQRFLLEARALAKLESANIVQVLDYGVDTTEDGTDPFIILEWLEGVDLSQILKKAKRLPPDRLFWMLRQVGRGLATAHAANIVHRDIKPANIFLTTRDGQTVVKIVDFGLADAPTARPGDPPGSDSAPVNTVPTHPALIGSTPYMSPEQADGATTDARTDLWALGIILYQALTGAHPFGTEKGIALLLKMAQEPHDPVSKHIPSTAPLEAFFARAFTKAREGRFQTVAELVNAFEATLPSVGAFNDQAAGQWVARMAAGDGRASVVDVSAQVDAPGTESDSSMKRISDSDSAHIRRSAVELPKQHRRVPLAAGVVGSMVVVALVGFIIAKSSGSSPAAPSTSTAVEAQNTGAPSTNAAKGAPSASSVTTASTATAVATATSSATAEAPKKTRVHIDVTPSDATIVLADNPVGSGPTDIDVEQGASIEVKKPNCESKRATYQGEATLTFALLCGVRIAPTVPPPTAKSGKVVVGTNPYRRP